MTYETITHTPQLTQELAARLAVGLNGGEVIELASDLGGGKTTFVQGLVRALGYQGEITSPTFTLSRIYNLNSGLEVHHYDLYRLSEGGILGDELAEDLGASKIVTIIEWAGVISDILPKDRLRIEFAAIGENDREIRFTGLGSRHDELIKGFTV
jgi:tRNA threonylcarbamoyladenosine biosynthesis protein TsaE